MAVQYRLNYPIETDTARKFWESNFKVNRCIAIIAFSLDKENAIKNLRRVGGYPFIFRLHHAWNNFGCYVNNPKMDGSDGKVAVPYYDNQDDWWNVMPYQETEVCWTPGAVALAFVNNLPATKTANVGDDVTFTVSVRGGKKPYTYKWFKGSTELVDGTNWTGNTNAPSITNHSVTTASSGVFKVEVTDADGTKITSASCTLTVTAVVPKLAWVNHPANGVIGTPLSFSWTGGVAPYTTIVTNTFGTEHDNKSPSTSPYTLSTTLGPSVQPGSWKVEVFDSTGTKIEQVVTMASSVQNVSLAKSDITITFSGNNGAGVASTPTSTKTGFTLAADKKTALSNGDDVVVTATANNGFTVNGKSSDTFTFTVSGLTTVVVPVITAKTAPTNFTIGSPDLEVTDLFSIVPVGTAMTMTVDASGHATLVSGKLHAATVGDTVVTAHAANATDKSLTVSVKAADVPMSTMDTASGFMGMIGAVHPAMPFHIEPSTAKVAKVEYEFDDPAKKDADGKTYADRGITLAADGKLTVPLLMADGTTPQSDKNVGVSVTVTDTTGKELVSSSDYHMYEADHYSVLSGSHVDLDAGTTAEMTYTWDKDGWEYTFSNETGTPNHYEQTFDLAVPYCVSTDPTIITVAVNAQKKVMVTAAATATSGASAKIHSTFTWGGYSPAYTSSFGDETGISVN